MWSIPVGCSPSRGRMTKRTSVALSSMELDANKKPEPLHTYEVRPRRCLMCRDPFMSSWPGERVCRKCKSSATWRTSALSVGLPLYVYRPGQPPRRLLEDYGDDVVLFWMVAGPILLLLVGRYHSYG